MLKFSDYLIESIYDSLEGARSDETERHRKQYYDDSTPESIFHVLNGRYLLDRDRTDLDDKFKKGEEIKLQSIAKVHDKNGVVRYHGITDKGVAIPMSHFKKPPIGRAGKNQQKLEQEQINNLHGAIQKKLQATGNKTIKIKTADGKIHEVAGVTAPKNTGWPKADAYLYGENGEPLHWMSLKGDSFQQWGGYKGLDEHPVMREAIEKFQKIKNSLNPNEKYLPRASAYHFKLDANNPMHRELLLKSMYGIDRGKEYGPNNVNAIYSGNTVYLKKHPTEDYYELHPNALYINRNDDKSDVSDAKVLLTNRAGLNQKGTGGRIMVTHSGNVANSRDVNNIQPSPSATIPKQQNPTTPPLNNDGTHGGPIFKGPTDA